MSERAIQHAQEVKRRHEQDLMRKPNVVGVGIGYRTIGGKATSEICIVVSVKAKVAALELRHEDLIPPSIENVPVDVIETGPVRAL